MSKILRGLFNSREFVILFLSVPALLLYCKSWTFGFTTLDEQWLIIGNSEYLKSWSSVTDAFTHTLNGLYYRPLLAVSIVMDYKIGALNPTVYHITNTLWHITCVFLLFKLLLLFNVPRAQSAAHSFLFSITPALMHAVAWVPGRNDVMLCAFTLAALINLKKHILNHQTRYILLNLFFFICALFTKENAVFLVVVFLAVIYRQPIRKKLALTVTWLAIIAMWLCLRNAVVPAVEDSTIPVINRIATLFVGFLTYLGKGIFPLYQSVMPSLNSTDIIVGTVFAIVILLGYLKFGIRSRNALVTGLLLFTTLLILPLWFSSGKSNGELYEHRNYTSLCGMILLLAQIKMPESKITMVAVVLISTFFFVKSFLRMNVYRNEQTFLQNAVVEAPEHYLMQIQYARSLLSRSQIDSAITYYNKAITLRPDKHVFLSERSDIYFRKGNYKAALADINMALERSGFNPQYRLCRLKIYIQMDNMILAKKDLTTLLNCCSYLLSQELIDTIEKKEKDLRAVH